MSVKLVWNRMTNFEEILFACVVGSSAYYLFLKESEYWSTKEHLCEGWLTVSSGLRKEPVVRREILKTGLG